MGAVIGKPNFGYLIGHINGGEIRYGDFLTAIINFLLIAAVVLLLPRSSQPNTSLKFHPTPATPATNAGPQCLRNHPAGSHPLQILHPSPDKLIAAVPANKDRCAAIPITKPPVNQKAKNAKRNDGVERISEQHPVVPFFNPCISH